MLKQQLWTGENVMRLQRSWLPALSSAFPSRTTTDVCALRWVLPSALPVACWLCLQMQKWEHSQVPSLASVCCRYHLHVALLLRQAAPVWRCFPVVLSVGRASTTLFHFLYFTEMLSNAPWSHEVTRFKELCAGGLWLPAFTCGHGAGSQCPETPPALPHA